MFSVIAAFLIPSALPFYAQKMPSKNRIAEVSFIYGDFDISALDNQAWETGKPVKVDHYWSGSRGPSSRSAEVVLLWSETAFYVRFTALQREPLVVSASPELRKKSIGLWDRDVCEVFIAPFEDKPNKYFEFEIAPNGEWLDVAIEKLPDRRISDWEYNSGMTSATRLEKDKVILAIKVEWKALGRAPNAGDRWKGNLFRCVGRDAGRGYLAWQPTMTPSPNFHVPEKFGEFLFTKPIVP